MIHKLITTENGNRFWFLDHKLNHYGGAASEWSDGAKYWFKNDKLYKKQEIYGHTEQ